MKHSLVTASGTRNTTTSHQVIILPPVSWQECSSDTVTVSLWQGEERRGEECLVYSRRCVQYPAAHVEMFEGSAMNVRRSLLPAASEVDTFYSILV